jgi:hypothetical protein
MTERLTEDLRAAYKKGQIKIDTHRPFIYDILRTWKLSTESLMLCGNAENVSWSLLSSVFVIASFQSGAFKEDAVMANTISSLGGALTVTFDINAVGRPLLASTQMTGMPTKLVSIHAASVWICPAYFSRINRACHLSAFSGTLTGEAPPPRIVRLKQWLSA